MNLNSMSKQQLIDYAADKGFALDETLTKSKMIELIEDAESKVKADAIRSTENTIKKWCKDYKDSCLTVKFQNLDSPGADLEFTLSKGIKLADYICPKCKSKFFAGKFDAVPHCDSCDMLAVKKPIMKNADYHFHFYDGDIYDIPRQIIAYLHGLQTRDDKAIVDPVTGLVRTRKGFRNRFACLLMNVASVSA